MLIQQSNFEDIENYQEVCFDLAPREAPSFTFEGVEHYIRPLTLQIIGACATLGISVLSNVTISEFLAKQELASHVDRYLALDEEDEPVLITANDLLSHKGLRVSVPYIPVSVFLERIYAEVFHNASAAVAAISPGLRAL